MFNSALLRAVVLTILLVGAVTAADVATTTTTAAEATDGDRGSPIVFQAEVSKMLDILINSLYTNRAVFLRELISNGSDALDKIRVMYLTSPKEPVNKDGVAPTMDIRIICNRSANEVVIRDGGVGMTKKELGDHLGSLGTSGTKRFHERMAESTGASGGDAATNSNNLIGQFGVGFYSVFLVGNSVRVASKSDLDDKQWVWESKGDGQFFIYEDPRGNTLGRGTEITIDVKPDSSHYLAPEAIKLVVHKYSEFINFPIYVEEEYSVPVNDTDTDGEAEPEPEPEPEPEDNASSPEFFDLEGNVIKKEKKREVKTITLRRWTRVNENRPIWTRPLGNVTEEEYNTFYKTISKDYRDPMYYSHFKVEGEVEFDSILFIPNSLSDDELTEDPSLALTNIKLYVRRVFITDEFRDLLPRYLNFVKGIVDSNDLPLNVSREVLQESRILRVIKKKLVRKALMMFGDIAAQDEAMENGTNVERPNSGSKHLEVPTYERFWGLFGKHLRYGLMVDTNHRNRLTKLFRYKSSKSNNTLTGLQAYVSRMQRGQMGIYYLTGESIDRIENSPVLEDAIANNVEVLYMDNPIDEYVVSQVSDFVGWKLINLAKEGIRFGEETALQRILQKKRVEKFEPFFGRLRDLFGHDQVQKVILTTRKTSGAFLLSSGENQITARLASLMRSQTMTLSDAPKKAERILEVNYRHPLVNEMYNRFLVDENDTVATDIAWVLFDSANLQAEFPISDIALYGRRIDRLLRSSVDILADGSLLPDDAEEFAVSTEEKDAEEELVKAEPRKRPVIVTIPDIDDGQAEDL